MRTHQRIAHVSAITLLMAATSASAALMPAGSSHDLQPPPIEDAIFLHSGGIGRLLVDERDHALRDALWLIGDRVAELRDDFGGPFAPPAEVFKMLGDLLLRPLTLRVDVDEEFDPMVMFGPPFNLQLIVGMNTDDEAADHARTMLSLMEETGAPEPEPMPDQPGMFILDADDVQLYVGSTQVGDRPVFALGVKRLSLEPTPLGGFGLPAEVRPAFVMRVDAGRMQPLMEMFIAQAGPGGEMIRGQLEMAGVMGEHALVFDLAIGHGPDRSYLASRYVNYGENPMYRLLLPSRPLSRDDLALVPADATFAQVNRAALRNLGSYFRQTFSGIADEAPDMPDPFAMMEEQFGIDLETDILQHLGETMGIYMSDTTGGGGAMSTVMFLETSDADALRAGLAKITGVVNEFAQMQAQGFVEFRERTVAGRTITTLTFPGLPVPLELSYAVERGFLFAAITPQALIAALRHAEGSDRTLVNNARFREMSPGGLEQSISVQFIDTPRALRDGYGMMSLGMSALSNAVKSARDPERDAGLIMPTFADLARDAKAIVVFGRMEGADMVVEGRMDRSMIVNMTGAMGTVGGLYGLVMVPAFAMGAAMPAMGRARGQAEDMRSAATMREIAMAVHAYHADRNAMPGSLRDLINDGYITDGHTRSTFGPVEDDQGDIWLNTEIQALWDEPRPDRVIIAYDRAMLLNYWKVATAFADGHVEILDVDEFLDQIENEHNRRFDFHLPW